MCKVESPLSQDEAGHDGFSPVKHGGNWVAGSRGCSNFSVKTKGFQTSTTSGSPTMQRLFRRLQFLVSPALYARALTFVCRAQIDAAWSVTESSTSLIKRSAAVSLVQILSRSCWSKPTSNWTASILEANAIWQEVIAAVTCRMPGGAESSCRARCAGYRASCS